MQCAKLSVTCQMLVTSLLAQPGSKPTDGRSLDG
jgi:hypothetical protein